MKVQIIGIGNVGGAIANNLLQMEYVTDLRLIDTDTKLLDGQYMDLNRVKSINNLACKLKIGTVPQETGYHYNIICAGNQCKYECYYTVKEAIQALFNSNYPLVQDIVGKINEGKFIIVTNPADRIFDILRLKYPRKDIDFAGRIADKIHEGKEIKRLKGYTNYGIAAEVLSMIFPGRDTNPCRIDSCPSSCGQTEPFSKPFA